MRRIAFFLVALLASPLFTTLRPPPAAAQVPTPTATITNAGDTTRLQLGSDGGFYVPGTFGPTSPADSIPATGPGTRLMWYPAKAAFRAGRVRSISRLNSPENQEEHWNPSNVGNYSVAFGDATKASGTYSMAVGSDSRAEGEGAVAIGNQVTAASDYSLTIGKANRANRSADGSLLVIGNGTPNANRKDALVLDQNGKLEVSGGFVLPDGTTLDEGDEVLSQTQSDASAVRNKDGFVATGRFGSGSIPLAGPGTRMMWYPKKAAFRAGQVGKDFGGDQWDPGKIGKHSVAFGVDTRADGESAVAMGMGTVAATDHSFTIGEANNANRSADGSLFVVGDGSVGGGAPSDALVLKENGNLKIDGNYKSISDRRLKTSIRPLEDGMLAKLRNIRPVRFEYKNPDIHPPREQIGLVAQDVQSEFPQLVSGAGDEHLSLSYSRLTAVLLKGLQEQQATIEAQQQKLEEKDDEIAGLRSSQKDIRARLARLEQATGTSAAPAGWGGFLPLRSLAVLLVGGLLGAGLLHLRRRA
jgi:hypothetical protein